MTGTYELAALPQQTINRWYDFVATGDTARLSPPLLAEDIVFRSSFVQMPIPGHEGPAGGRRDHGEPDWPQLAWLKEAAKTG